MCGGVEKGGFESGSRSPGLNGADEEQGTGVGVNGGGVREECDEGGVAIDGFA
jgi:hypothetical protein